MIRCSNCGETNPEPGNFCGNCGHELAVLSAPQPQDFGAPSSCLNCGAQLTPDDLRCGSCGRLVHSPGAPVEELADSGARSRPAGEALPLRSFSDLLAESARLLRDSPWMFLGIGLIPQLPGVIGLALTLPIWLEVLILIGGLILTALAVGAVIHAVACGCLGLPASVTISFTKAKQRSVYLVVSFFALLLLLLVSFVLIFIIIGIPVFFLLMVLLWFYPQGIMVENLSPVDAFRQSTYLVRGNWWRVFGTGVAFWAPVMISMGIVYGLADDPARSPVAGLAFAVIGAVAIPWLMIGSTLLYFDLRARQGDFNLEVLNAEMTAAQDGRGRSDFSQPS